MLKTGWIAGIVMGALLPVSAMAETGERWKRWDLIEDRIDRAESHRDRQVTLGPRDLIEDRIDRWEDRRDRANLPRPRAVNRWERRSWHRLAH